MREYEFTSNWGMSKQCWLINRQERERFGKMVRQWKKETPKATLLQEMLVEELVALHIYSQRLRDRRYFFDGEKADYAKVADHEVDVHTEDLERQTREWEKYMPLIQRWKTDLLKLALANDIKVEFGGDITDFFSAVDKKNLGRNGDSDKEKNESNLT